mgnify:CR=1 FL=1
MSMTVSETLRQLATALEEAEALKLRVAELEEELRVVKNKVPEEQQEWFNTREAAKLIGRSPDFLNQDRLKKPAFIPFRKDSYRVVRYHRSDLQTFIEARKGKGKKIKASERRG